MKIVHLIILMNSNAMYKCNSCAEVKDEKIVRENKIV